MGAEGVREEVITKFYFSCNDTIVVVLLVMMMYCIHIIFLLPQRLYCQNEKDVCLCLCTAKSEDCNDMDMNTVQ